MSHKITFRQQGQGPLLILLHGYGGSVQHWEGVAKNLAADYQVIVPSMSHVYMSSDKLFFSVQVEVLARFIRENFPDRKVHVVGTSYGGALAWALACQCPDLVETLSLINPMVTDPLHHFLPTELKFFFSIPLNLKSIYVLLATPMGRLFLKRAAQLFRDERSEGPVAIEHLQGRKLQFVAHMIHHFVWILRSEDWTAWNQKLSQYKGECRFIYDKMDPLFSKEVYVKFAEQMNCHDVHALTGAGHLAIKSRPETIAEMIRQFIQGHSKAA